VLHPDGRFLILEEVVRFAELDYANAGVSHFTIFITFNNRKN